MPTTTTRKHWSKRKKALILGGVPLGMIATTAAAAAIFFATAGVQGGGTTGEFTAQFGGNPTMDASALMVAPQSGPQVAGGKLSLPAGLQMFPGESLSITASVRDGGEAQRGYVSGLDFSGMPSGYSAELTSGCGALTDPEGIVTIKITAGASQTPGQAWTLSPSAGVKVTPGDKPAGLACQVFTAP